MAEVLQPATREELCEFITNSARIGAKLRIRGGGSKDAIGAPTPDIQVLDMRGFNGGIAYDPPELVLTARSATPLAEIEQLVASKGQMLAFEPFDHGPMLGLQGGSATIGGIVAAGIAGPRRLSSGGARDHVLGFEAVSGRGELFRAGSKVVKNVTGFDLSKLVAGSWGRLVALTEVTLKVLPRPEVQQSMLLPGLDPEAAIAIMAKALGSSAGVAAAAYLPRLRGRSSTLFRLEGFPESVAARANSLQHLIGEGRTVERLDKDEGELLWHGIRDAAVLPAELPLWRVILAPGRAPAFVAKLDPGEWFFDWAGGLVWIASSVDAAVVRNAAALAGGHATLIRGSAASRSEVPAFHPQGTGIAAIESRVRQAFDPAQVFDFGRF
jgi:glycolate oxidase FAD binding subunit